MIKDNCSTGWNAIKDDSRTFKWIDEVKVSHLTSKTNMTG
jgi:hypothetical protein